MLAPKVSKPNTKAGTDATTTLARLRSSLSAQRDVPLEQGMLLNDRIGNQRLEALRKLAWDFSTVPLCSPQGTSLSPAPSPRPRIVQPKLMVGDVHDALEQEADRVADQVAAGPATSGLSRSLPHVQRAAASAAAIEGAGKAGTAPASVDSVLASAGRPLEPALREYFGRRFGHDFSPVRLHTGPAATRSAYELNARAYTSGNAIVFGDGQFAPQTAAGRRLLAHELTHTIQQGAAAGLQPKLIQRQLAPAPAAAGPAAVVLSAAEMRAALRFNTVLFTDAPEIAILRDVLGIAREPSVIDEDFVNALVRFQTRATLKEDGQLGAATAGPLEREITARADTLAEPATGTPLRRVARRLHLRAMTSRRSGTVTHQGFVGPDGNPTGAVTARTGDREGTSTNVISLEHTGENSDNVDWLQFINMRMSATPPGAAAPVFNVGAVGTTGGPVTWSNAATTNWFVDAVPGGSPLYNVSGGHNTRAAARRLAMFDQPGGASGLPIAQAFTAAAAPAAAAPRVTMRMGFAAYVVRNNRARYHVDWSATTTYDIAAASSSNIVYAQGGAGSVAGLRGVHRAALLAEYPGNPIV